MKKRLALFLFSLLVCSVVYGQTITTTTTLVTAVSSANASVTATLPAAGAGLFHYITLLEIERSCTAAIIGSAIITPTTTNIPGSLAFTLGNACALGSSNTTTLSFNGNPVKTSAANTDTTMTCPAIGLTGICRVTIFYYIAP